MYCSIERMIQISKRFIHVKI